ncbi:NIPSNAP protein [Dyadobacter jejuensis]|uniref:NIPSNAP protein n=1 Tax=Dyadobacter jejuensis TaxID=1082580 RepID=A0A316AH35_9BACT|nr:NIPSNAP family protein [Dyadobacter jejuensis]PWJ56599.1 NIPSNAP protein [Dyadobacter jejuensis]
MYHFSLKPFALLFLALITSLSWAKAPKREFYQIKIYRINSSEQGDRVEKYLKDAYIPAMHRIGIKNIGVFKPVTSDSLSGKQIYVLTPFKSLDQLAQLPSTLEKDKQYLSAGKDYLDAAYNNAPYQRIETTILRAFEGHPFISKPALSGSKAERIYELRSYESATEKLHLNKVRMFNDGNEVGIFDRLGFNAVFYGEVVSGGTMPNLMYMTTFDNKASRDAHWKAFTDDAEWAKVKVIPEFQHNVSKNIQKFLFPTEYSDI